MTRWVHFAPLALLTFAMHTSKPLPVAEALIINTAPLSSLSLPDQRDSLVAWEARKQGVPTWLALSISHAENWQGLDSTATNSFSNAVGLMQIHPNNFGRYPGCGTAHITNRRRNVCMGISVLRECLDKHETLANVLSCYGGATSSEGKKNYNLAVARKMKMEWLEK